MKPHQHRFSSGQKESLDASTQQSRSSDREFASPEELLRFDAAQTAVPDSIARRLAESTAREPAPPPLPWWKRLFQ
ncbi:MAG: hypothetical protein U1F98_00085 [Verrucomicrobiota bacterium]